MNENFERELVREEDGEKVVDLREIVNVLLSKLFWIILCTAVFVAGAAVYTKMFVAPLTSPPKR